jgi:hypothetical protein
MRTVTPTCPTTGIDEYSSWTWAASDGQPQYFKAVLPQYATGGADVVEPFRPTYIQNSKPMITYLDPYDRPDFEDMQTIKNIWDSSNPPGHGAARGDIVWAPKEGFEHMMMVVGWGPMLITWEEIDAFWAANCSEWNDEHTQCLEYDYTVLTTDYPESNHAFAYNPHPDFGYVPYLVDHGLHGAAEEGPGGQSDIPVLICPACVQPRPYYALYWHRQNAAGIPIVSNLHQVDNAPQFIHIPDSLSIPVEEVKAPPPRFNRDEIPTPTSPAQ